MSRLLRGIARTAVISGTATAVSGRVQRNQAVRFAESDAQTAALRRQAYEDVTAAPSPPPAPAASPAPAARSLSPADVIEQLTLLGTLRTQGILTEEEFAVQKARILAG